MARISTDRLGVLHTNRLKVLGCKNGQHVHVRLQRTAACQIIELSMDFLLQFETNMAVWSYWFVPHVLLTKRQTQEMPGFYRFHTEQK